MRDGRPAGPGVTGASQRDILRGEPGATGQAHSVIEELPSAIQPRTTHLRPTGPIRVALRDERRNRDDADHHDEGDRQSDAPARPAHATYPLHRAEGGIIDGPGRDSDARGEPVEAVLLDAFGTLLELEPPAPRLHRLLADAGYEHPLERVAAAITAEIRHYRRHHDRGRDAPSLAELRAECAGVLARALDGRAPPGPDLVPMLLDSLRFRLAPDAVPALDALARAGVALAVVSNWDCSLGEVLEDLGVAHRFAVVSVSALVGARKPDPVIFHHALTRLGVAPARALHCGDRPEFDCLGARNAGLRAVLVDRAGALPDGPCPRVRSLVEVARWARA